jgi:hypothetical protein
VKLPSVPPKKETKFTFQLENVKILDSILVNTVCLVFKSLDFKICDFFSSTL